MSDNSVTSGRTIHLYLEDGVPEGIISTRMGNWVGRVLTAPRPRLSELLRRAECSQTGVYVMLGPDPDRSGGTLGYIGEADDVAARLRYHVSSGDRDFFDRAAVIVASDNNLTKGHVRYLESRLIRTVRTAASVALANTREPDFRRLPDADRADMDYFLDQLRIVLPVLSFDLFRAAAPIFQPASPSGQNAVFVFAPTGASARAAETPDGFVIMAGSTARKAETGTFPAGYRTLRDELLGKGQLVDGGQTYRFTGDVVFSSPSAAASIVAGRSATGPGEWKLEGTGTTYREWKAADLD